MQVTRKEKADVFITGISLVREGRCKVGMGWLDGFEATVHLNSCRFYTGDSNTNFPILEKFIEFATVKQILVLHLCA